MRFTRGALGRCSQGMGMKERAGDGARVSAARGERWVRRTCGWLLGIVITAKSRRGRAEAERLYALLA